MVIISLNIYIFLPFFSFVSFCDSHYGYVVMLGDGQQVSDTLFFFLISSFFLFLRLDNLNSPIFKFTDSFFSLLKSAVEILYWFINFTYYTLSELLFGYFFYYFYLLILHIWSYIILILSFSCVVLC